MTAAADWNLFAEPVVRRFQTFAVAGDNVVGVRRRAIAAGEPVRESSPRKGELRVATLELLPAGPQLYAFEALRMHVTAAGVPHRVPHSFGYWHINDMDELYLPLPGAAGELGHFLVIMAKPSGSEGESFAWYCERCWTLLHEYRFAHGRLGLGEFWRAERAAVDGYNRDPRHRTCPECGTLNPLAYCAARIKDRPEEAAARERW